MFDDATMDAIVAEALGAQPVPARPPVMVSAFWPAASSEEPLSFDLPIPAPRFNVHDDMDQCIGLATSSGPWPICVRCARHTAQVDGWQIVPAAVIGADGAECVNRLVRVG